MTTPFAANDTSKSSGWRVHRDVTISTFSGDADPLATQTVPTGITPSPVDDTRNRSRPAANVTNVQWTMVLLSAAGAPVAHGSMSYSARVFERANDPEVPNRSTQHAYGAAQTNLAPYSVYEGAVELRGPMDGWYLQLDNFANEPGSAVTARILYREK